MSLKVVRAVRERRQRRAFRALDQATASGERRQQAQARPWSKIVTSMIRPRRYTVDRYLDDQAARRCRARLADLSQHGAPGPRRWRPRWCDWRGRHERRHSGRRAAELLAGGGRDRPAPGSPAGRYSLMTRCSSSAPAPAATAPERSACAVPTAGSKVSIVDQSSVTGPDWLGSIVAAYIGAMASGLPGCGRSGSDLTAGECCAKRAQRGRYDNGRPLPGTADRAG